MQQMTTKLPDLARARKRKKRAGVCVWCGRKAWNGGVLCRKDTMANRERSREARRR